MKRKKFGEKYNKFIIVFMGLPDDSDGKESACNAGDLGPNTGLGRSPGEGNGYRLQCSGRHRNLAGYNQWDHKESDTAK